MTTLTTSVQNALRDQRILDLIYPLQMHPIVVALKLVTNSSVNDVFRHRDDFQCINIICQFQSIKAAGHHLYADQPENFHQIVNSICDEIEWWFLSLRYAIRLFETIRRGYSPTQGLEFRRFVIFCHPIRLNMWRVITVLISCFFSACIFFVSFFYIYIYQ